MSGRVGKTKSSENNRVRCRVSGLCIRGLRIGRLCRWRIRLLAAACAGCAVPVVRRRSSGRSHASAWSHNGRARRQREFQGGAFGAQAHLHRRSSVVLRWRCSQPAASCA